MEKLDIFRKEAAESYAAGQRDSRHFMNMYRAYLRGASDAAGQYGESEAERESSLKLTIAAMAFTLLGWFITMYFVFK